MRRPNFTSTWLFATLLPLAHAVSLADMAPRAKNLSSACEAIYVRAVPGCTAHDFISRTCSQQCIWGLESLVDPIKMECIGVTGENLIFAYLENQGPQQICLNAPPGSGDGLPLTGSPTGPMGPTSQWSAEWPTGTATLGTSVSTAKSFTKTPKSLDIDTSTYSHPTTSSSHTTSTPTTTHTTTTATTPRHDSPIVSPQTTSTTSTTSASVPPTSSSTSRPKNQPNVDGSGDGSGGGSPFDVGSGAATQSISLPTLLLSAAVALLVVVR